MNTKIIYIACIILTLIAVAVILTQQTPQPQQTFNVSFNLEQSNVSLPHYKLKMDVWQIRVYQNKDATLRDVDVWVNGEIVRHYDYLTNRMGIIEEATVVSGKGVSVSIYWEGGQESFHSP